MFFLGGSSSESSTSPEAVVEECIAHAKVSVSGSINPSLGREASFCAIIKQVSTDQTPAPKSTDIKTPILRYFIGVGAEKVFLTSTMSIHPTRFAIDMNNSPMRASVETYTELTLTDKGGSFVIIKFSNHADFMQWHIEISEAIASLVLHPIFSATTSPRGESYTDVALGEEGIVEGGVNVDLLSNAIMICSPLISEEHHLMVRAKNLWFQKLSLTDIVVRLQAAPHKVKKDEVRTIVSVLVDEQCDPLLTCDPQAEFLLKIAAKVLTKSELMALLKPQLTPTNPATPMTSNTAPSNICSPRSPLGQIALNALNALSRSDQQIISPPKSNAKAKPKDNYMPSDVASGVNENISPQISSITTIPPSILPSSSSPSSSSNSASVPSLSSSSSSSSSSASASTSICLTSIAPTSSSNERSSESASINTACPSTSIPSSTPIMRSRTATKAGRKKKLLIASPTEAMRVNRRHSSFNSHTEAFPDLTLQRIPATRSMEETLQQAVLTTPSYDLNDDIMPCDGSDCGAVSVFPVCEVMQDGSSNAMGACDSERRETEKLRNDSSTITNSIAPPSSFSSTESSTPPITSSSCSSVTEGTMQRQPPSPITSSSILASLKDFQNGDDAKKLISTAATMGLHDLLGILSKTPVWILCAILCTFFICTTSFICVLIISLTRMLGGAGTVIPNNNVSYKQGPNFTGASTNDPLNFPFSALPHQNQQQPYPYAPHFASYPHPADINMHKYRLSPSNYAEKDMEHIMYMSQYNPAEGVASVGGIPGTHENSPVSAGNQPRTQVGSFIQHLSRSFFHTIPNKIAEKLLRFACFISFGLGCHPMLRHKRQPVPHF